MTKMGKKMKKSNEKQRRELEKFGLEAIQELLKYLPPVRPLDSNGFLTFTDRPEQEPEPYPDEVVEHKIPKKLEGYRPLGIAISRPGDARTKIIGIEKLNPEEPFRRFEDVLVTYVVAQKGVPPKTRTAVYYKQRGEDLESLDALAKFFAKQEQFRSRPEPRQTKSFNSYSQWWDAKLEFDEYSACVAQLADLETQLQGFGSALRSMILHHGEMAYHLGLRVREAELLEFQHRAAGLRMGGSVGGRGSATKAKKQADEWQIDFTNWLDGEIQAKTYDDWWQKVKWTGKRRNSVASLCEFASDNWPEGGFRTQTYAPVIRTLRKIISEFKVFDLLREPLEGVSEP